ncbi:hypothetical protein C8T65DRAFT_580272 [Cerioporus squamosus]|nr:hypothetical protein C8T65DRAFT_580272 [Cerioporus squamosus]
MQNSLCGDALRHCNNCAKRETSGAKLRKCGGCSTAFYCSVECQKAEWRRHKGCGDSGSLRYESVDVFARDLQDFMEAHSWAFRMLISVQRQLQRDANPDVPSSELSRLLRFRLRCQATISDTHKHRNPATRFLLVSHTFEDLDTYASNSELVWEQSAAMRDEAHRAYTLQYPRYTGQLFAVKYKVPGTHAGAMNYFPVETPRAPAPGTPEQRRPILEDMAEFCTRSINHGFPMRMQVSGHAFTLLAYPGTFVRSERRWTWQAIFEDWKSYTPGQHRRLDLAVAEMKTRMTIPQLILSSLQITSGVSVLISEDALHP